MSPRADKGHPLRTRVAIRSTIQSTHSDEAYSNDVMQFMTLRLGRVTNIEAMEDTAKFERFLASMDHEAFPDSIAAPLND